MATQFENKPFATTLWMRPVSQFPTNRRDHLSSPERLSFPRSPWDTASKASEKANRLPPLESSAPPRGRCWRRARRAVPRAGETCGRMPALRCPFPPSRPAGAAVGAGRCRERGGRQRLGRGAGAAAGECAGQRRRPHLARAPAMSARRSPERRGGRAESRPKVETGGDLPRRPDRLPRGVGAEGCGPSGAEGGGAGFRCGCCVRCGE